MRDIFCAFFPPLFAVLGGKPKGTLDDFWKFLLGPFLIRFQLLLTGLLFRKGHWCPARGDEALLLVQTPASIHRRVPASSANPCTSHQPGIPERYTAEMDSHVSGRTCLSRQAAAMQPCMWPHKGQRGMGGRVGGAASQSLSPFHCLHGGLASPQLCGRTKKEFIFQNVM